MADLLIEFAESFVEVPPEVAKKPYSKSNLVPGCESEAYVWSKSHPQKGLKFYFAVENPQGISAKALAAILDQTLSGEAVDEVALVSPEIVYGFFGKGISMGKGQGLMSMVGMFREFAKGVK